MALYRCGGGGMSETVLWTNPSPTGSFAGQTVTFSQDAINFDLIKVYYNQSTSSGSVENFIMFDLNILIDNTNTRVALNTFESSTPKQRIRVVSKGSDSNSLYFDDCYKMITSSSQTPGKTNGNCIPTKITGVKLP